jgi:hypothetical protein
MVAAIPSRRLDRLDTYYVPIQGTNSWTDIPLKRLVMLEPLWWQVGSRFTRFLRTQNLRVLLPDLLPFIWDTDLSGVFWRPHHRDWQAAGANLLRYFELPEIRYKDRNVIAHSHGLQVVMYACAQGLLIRNLITIAGPVREDMRNVSEIARTRIGYWLAISDPDDPVQRKGEWFDGGSKYVSMNPYADVNDSVVGIAHSRVLYDEQYFHYWTVNNWPSFLRIEQKEM